MANILIPSSQDEMLGWRVERPLAPAVRWHPVWDVPRMPRKLPESEALPQPSMPELAQGGPMHGHQPMNGVMGPPPMNLPPHFPPGYGRGAGHPGYGVPGGMPGMQMGISPMGVAPEPFMGGGPQEWWGGKGGRGGKGFVGGKGQRGAGRANGKGGGRAGGKGFDGRGFEGKVFEGRGFEGRGFEGRGFDAGKGRGWFQRRGGRGGRGEGGYGGEGYEGGGGGDGQGWAPSNFGDPFQQE